MFTLEVAGKPIAVTNASEEEARDVFESDAFREDLKTVESEGAPIWDGFATLSIRPATRGMTSPRTDMSPTGTTASASRFTEVSRDGSSRRADPGERRPGARLRATRSN